MGFCEPARQDYSPPDAADPGTRDPGGPGGPNGGSGYAPPPPRTPAPPPGSNPLSGTGLGGDVEQPEPEVERHEYDPEACKVQASERV